METSRLFRDGLVWKFLVVRNIAAWLNTELSRSNPVQWSNVWGTFADMWGYLSARVTLNERRNITYVRAYKKAPAGHVCRFICTRQMIKILRRYFHGNDDHSAHSVFNGRQRPFRGSEELCHDAGTDTKNGPFCYILSARSERSSL